MYLNVHVNVAVDARASVHVCVCDEYMLGNQLPVRFWEYTISIHMCMEKRTGYTIHLHTHIFIASALSLLGPYQAHNNIDRQTVFLHCL